MEILLKMSKSLTTSIVMRLKNHQAKSHVTFHALKLDGAILHGERYYIFQIHCFEFCYASLCLKNFPRSHTSNHKLQASAALRMGMKIDQKSLNLFSSKILRGHVPVIPRLKLPPQFSIIVYVNPLIWTRCYRMM